MTTYQLVKQTRGKSSLWILIFFLFPIRAWVQQGTLELSSDGKLITILPDRYTSDKAFTWAMIKIPENEFTNELTPILKKRTEVLAELAIATSPVNMILDHFPAVNHAGFEGAFNNLLNSLYQANADVVFPKKYKDYAILLDKIAGMGAWDVLFSSDLGALFPYRLYFNDKEAETFLLIRTNVGYEVHYKMPAYNNHELKIKMQKTFPLKEAAIQWSNRLNENRNQKLLEDIDNIFHEESKRIGRVQRLLDSIELCSQFPASNQYWDSIRQLVSNTLDSQMHSLDVKFGDWENSILYHSSAIAEVVGKWLWVNGKVIRMNPFQFTENSKINEIDNIELNLHNIRLRYLDSLLNRIPASSERLGEKISFPQQIIPLLRKSMDSIQIYQTLIQNIKERKATNEKVKKDFTTVSNILYTGTILPFQLEDYTFTEKNKITIGGGKLFQLRKQKVSEYTNIWQRNFYLNNMPSSNPPHFKFYYPEKEFAVMSYHNIPAGVTLQFVPDFIKFADSASFTVEAGKAIEQASQLFVLLNPILQPTAGFMKLINQRLTRTQRDSISEAFSEEYPSQIASIQWKNYIKALGSFSAAEPIINSKLKPINDTNAVYRSIVFRPEFKEAPYQMNYSVFHTTKNAEGKEEKKRLDSSYFKVGKYHYFFLAGGVAWTPNAGRITSVDTSGGKFLINKDDDHFRIVAGVRIYPWGLYNQKNPGGLFDKYNTTRWKHRISILLATGFPKPFENLYAGAGLDVVPGLTISTGIHWQLNNRYSISNDKVESRSVKYNPHGFVALTLDPALLVKAVAAIF